MWDAGKKLSEMNYCQECQQSDIQPCVPIKPNADTHDWRAIWLWYHSAECAKVSTLSNTTQPLDEHVRVPLATLSGRDQQADETYLRQVDLGR